MTRNLQGDRLVWCEECYTYTKAKPDGNRCQRCGEESDRCRCIRCGYSWRPRYSITDDNPKYCPSCKSRYFDRQPYRTNAKKRRRVSG